MTNAYHAAHFDPTVDEIDVLKRLEMGEVVQHGIPAGPEAVDAQVDRRAGMATAGVDAGVDAGGNAVVEPPATLDFRDDD